MAARGRLMPKLIAWLLLAGWCVAVNAQIQTINPNDSVSTGPAKLNNNFAYLNTNKAGIGACPSNQVAIATLAGGISCVSLTAPYIPTLPYFAVANNLSEGVPATMRANLGGVVVGPGSSTLNDCAAFADTTGKLLKDVSCGAGASLVITTFSATPTFACTSSTTGTVTTFELSTALTANITSSTLTGCTNGQTLNFRLVQDGTGGRTIVWPSGFTGMCQPSPVASSTTSIIAFWDGTSAYGQCSTNGTGIGQETSAPSGNPPSTYEFDWLDSTLAGPRWKNAAGVFFAGSKELTSGNIRCAGGANTVDAACSAAQLKTVLGAQYQTLSCQPGLGDGLNAITAGTYLESTCWNKTGVTYTITSIQCFTDNAGSSTLDATNGTGTGLLTGAVTCSSTIASGTQSGTTTIANNDFIKFTFVADGTSKQTTWVIAGTY